MGRTAIEYVTHTWNPIVGCSHAGSPGCDQCYAARLAATRLKHHPLYEGLAEIKNGVARWTGEVRFNKKALQEPLKARKPRRYLVCSMGDLFHPSASMDEILDVWQVMDEAPQHKFLVLTKRPELMAEPLYEWLSDDPGVGIFSGGILGNVWLGVTVESQQYVWRIEELFKIPAAGYWISVEPCLGPLDLTLSVPCCLCHGTGQGIGDTDCPVCYGEGYDRRIGLVVLGGETGPNARPMHPHWVRKVQNDCAAAGVPFFFKSWGAWAERSLVSDVPVRFTTAAHEAGFWKRHRVAVVQRETDGEEYQKGEVIMVRVGKERAGRLLDGREWNELPSELLLEGETDRCGPCLTSVL